MGDWLEKECKNCIHFSGRCEGVWADPDNGFQPTACDLFVNKHEIIHEGKDLNTLTAEIEILNRVVAKKVKKLKADAGD